MMRRRHAFALAIFVFVAISFTAWARTVFIPSTIQPAPLGGARYTGKVIAIKGTSLQLALRGGQSITINFAAAQANHLVPPIYVGEFLQVQGTSIGAGMVNAAAVTRAKSAPAAWTADLP